MTICERVKDTYYTDMPNKYLYVMNINLKFTYESPLENVSLCLLQTTLLL